MTFLSILFSLCGIVCALRGLWCCLWALTGLVQFDEAECGRWMRRVVFWALLVALFHIGGDVIEPERMFRRLHSGW